MASLDTLSAVGAELTAVQLGDVDGGFVIAALVVLNMVIWGANGVVWVVEHT